MDTTEEDAAVARRRAAALMGSVRTPAKGKASAENGKAGGRPKGSGRPISPEAVERMKAAQQARREREKGGDTLGGTSE